MTSIILDCFVIGLLCLCVWVGYRKGLVASIVSLGGYIISLLAATWLGKLFAPMVFERWLRSGMIEKVGEQLASAGSVEELQAAVNQISDKIPGFLNGILFQGQTASDYMASHLGDSASSIAQDLVDQFLGPVTIFLLECILFVLLFAVCRLLVHIILKIAVTINYIPVIGTVNGLLGGCVGVFQAGVYLLLLAMVCEIIILFTHDSLGWLNTQQIESTYLFAMFYRFNPLHFF